MWIARLAAVLFAALGLAGCASGPRIVAITATITRPMAKSVTLNDLSPTVSAVTRKKSRPPICVTVNSQSTTRRITSAI